MISRVQEFCAIRSPDATQWTAGNSIEFDGQINEALATASVRFQFLFNFLSFDEEISERPKLQIL